jgi:hypothetical protein
MFRDIIFPTKSPVDALDAKRQRPLNKTPEVLKKLSVDVARRVGPLLQAKQEVDKVYSNGYFERHYPDADKTLKDTLHKKVLAAWTTAINHIEEEEEEKERKPSGGITIIINSEK